MNKIALYELLAQWGTSFSPEMLQQTQAAYAPLVTKPKESLVVRDIAYGSDERHRLDIFANNSTSQAPVLLFVHGGGFVMGDKGGPDSPFYNNVGAWAMDQGFVGATMTYRLAPAHPWPAGGEDVSAAIQWLTDNIDTFGGDPAKIFIMGQSAGAVHVADAVANSNSSPNVIRGALMVSGIYDLERAQHDNFQEAYYGTDQSQYRDRSTLHKLAGSNTSCMFAVCEHDPLDFQQQAQWLVEAWLQEKHRWPAIHWLRGHNHLSSVAQISSPFDTLGPIVKDFVEENS